jgi:hypothetical protein
MLPTEYISRFALEVGQCGWDPGQRQLEAQQLATKQGRSLDMSLLNLLHTNPSLQLVAGRPALESPGLKLSHGMSKR